LPVKFAANHQPDSGKWKIWDDWSHPVLTEPTVAMVVTMLGKIDLGQGVTGGLCRTGGN
jgi:hypothetical protein